MKGDGLAPCLSKFNMNLKRYRLPDKHYCVGSVNTLNVEATILHKIIFYSPLVLFLSA